VKVIAPSELVAEAALVVAPFWEEVVVIGAAALQIVLADDLGETVANDGEASAVLVTPTHDLDVVIVTPTRDVDLVVKTERAADIVRQPEDAGLEPSQEPYERGFTWIREDLKIQLVRSFHPFAHGAAETMPQNPALSLLDADAHTMAVAFEDAPDVPRLRCATSAALVALKEVAFGRSRPDGVPVERDFHDVYLVVDRRAADLESSYRAASLEVRPRVDHTLTALAEGGEATRAAARQHALITGDENRQDHELAIRRSAVFLQRRLSSTED
jgi:hypothetical protein